MGVRYMNRAVGGMFVYASSFDQGNGNLIRVIPEHDDKESRLAMYVAEGDHKSRVDEHLSTNKFPLECNMVGVPDAIAPSSPSPETIDVCITQFCGFGCSFCYQDSKTDTPVHAPMELFEKILDGFDFKPYQIAYGGGSPTSHPEFEAILRMTRESDVVPNYTTEGLNLTNKIVDATNEYCGGVSITFHGWKGHEFFEKTYAKFSERVTVQKNIHLIVDKDVHTNLAYLIGLQSKLKTPLRVILLAYYPGVGRSTWDLLPPFDVLNTHLPNTIKMAVSEGMHIAFSEGLLPYFLSRDILDTAMASSSEGRYSCYISEWGQMFKSSFNQDFPIAVKQPYSMVTSILSGSRQNMDYVARAVSSREEAWRHNRSSGYNHAEVHRSQEDVYEDYREPGRVKFDMSPQELWSKIATDNVSIDGGDKHSTFGCAWCKNEHKCSKEQTHDVHIMMCANHGK